jgi:large subunit ribosomal protein L19
MNPIDYVHEQMTGKKDFPAFKPGDNITVNYKIIEGNKERIQSFKGDVLKKQGRGHTASFTVRKISDGVGVERVFPFYSPNIDSIVLNKTGHVRGRNYFTSANGVAKVPGSVKSEWLLKLWNRNLSEKGFEFIRVAIILGIF